MVATGISCDDIGMVLIALIIAGVLFAAVMGYAIYRDASTPDDTPPAPKP